MSEMPEKIWAGRVEGYGHWWEGPDIVGQTPYARDDTAAAQVAAAYKRAALTAFRACKAQEAGYVDEKSRLAQRIENELRLEVVKAIRALATDTQADALEQVRREAERAGYERGVREAASRALHAMKGYTHPIGKGDRYALGVQAGAVRAKDEILALIDYPTPAPDTQADALELVRREAALKALADMGQEWDADTAAAQVAAAYERAANLCVDQFQAHLDLVITGNLDNARNRESAASMAEKLSHEIRALATDTQTNALELVRREARKEVISENDLYYLRAIQRRMGEFRDALDGLEALSIGGEAFADERDWLNCFIGAKTALLDNPTPDPDEQTEAARELALRKAVSS